MPEDFTKRCQVTFKTGLPMGTRAEFKHDGEHWIAYPRTKNAEILATLDRLISVSNRIRKEMMHWINQRPGDAELVIRAVQMLLVVRSLTETLVTDKTKAVTM